MKLLRGFPCKAFARGETSNLPWRGKQNREFSKGFIPVSQALRASETQAWRACRGFSFLVPNLQGRGRAHLEGAHCERLEVALAFPGVPSETSRVSETPLLELLCEEDPEPVQNHHDESSVVRSLSVSAASDTCGVVMDFVSPVDCVSALD